MNAFSGLVKEMEERGAKLNGYELCEAVVTNLKPLSISINKTNISFNLCVNAALNLELDIDRISTQEAELKEALSTLYKAFKLSMGDKVIVKRVGNIFYIISKVITL